MAHLAALWCVALLDSDEVGTFKPILSVMICSVLCSAVAAVWLLAACVMSESCVLQQ